MSRRLVSWPEHTERVIVHIFRHTGGTPVEVTLVRAGFTIAAAVE